MASENKIILRRSGEPDKMGNSDNDNDNDDDDDDNNNDNVDVNDNPMAEIK